MTTAINLQPARYDITIPQRATLIERITLDVDLTGCTVHAQVWNSSRTNKLLDMTPVATDPDTGNAVNVSAGELCLVSSASLTAAVTTQGVWDLRVTYPDGTADYWLQGIAYIDLGASRP